MNRALEFLQAVYSDNELPLFTRIRAAAMALPFEAPKLAVTAIVNEGGDFATLLDRRIQRYERIKNGGSPMMIEAKPIKENGGNADARLPPRIPDRRWRRI